MKRFGTFRRPAALLLALCILCSGCSSKVTASTIELMKTEGKVGVADESWKIVSLRENMKLYSGYHVSTEEESYAWINLDDTKLTKMDVNSQIDIQKNGKQLELLVNSGSLFFHVTQPLASDETMTIRTSTMTVGIRGTCGWVEAVNQEEMRVYILEGTVECTLPDLVSSQTLTERVTAGEMAELTVSPLECSITVAQFTADDIPSFVSEEAPEYTEPYSSVQPDDAADDPADDSGDEDDRGFEDDGEASGSLSTRVSYDPVTHIRRTTVDPQGYDVEIYYEIPFFEDAEAGYQAINDFFQTLENRFLDPTKEEIPALLQAWRNAGQQRGDAYYDRWGARIVSQTDKYLCVNHSWSYYDGGSQELTADAWYTFRTDTGTQLFLSDVADASAEDIEDYLMTMLNLANDRYPINLTLFQTYSADDYNFFIMNDTIYVTFNEYEGGGVIQDIALPMGLRAEWR